MANKEATVAELTDKFQSSAAVLLTEYRGLTVGELKELRRSISEHATYAVAKNTLLNIAAKNAGVTAFEGQLSVHLQWHLFTETQSPWPKQCVTLPRQILYW